MSASLHPPVLAQAASGIDPATLSIGPIGIAALILWVVAAVLMGWYLGSQLTSIRYATLADGQQLKRTLPLSFQLLLPFTNNVRMFRRTKYADLRNKTEKKLVSAGYDTVLPAADFLALRVLVPCVMAPALIILIMLVTSRLPGQLGVGFRELQGQLDR